jgi:hypothetical protein
MPRRLGQAVGVCLLMVSWVGASANACTQSWLTFFFSTPLNELPGCTIGLAAALHARPNPVQYSVDPEGEKLR